MNASQFARDVTVATSVGENILEKMKSMSTLAEITATGQNNAYWLAWVNTQGIPALPSETVNVTYTNPSQNLLQINVIVSWIRKGRTQNVNFTTRLTK